MFSFCCQCSLPTYPHSYNHYIPFLFTGISTAKSHVLSPYNHHLHLINCILYFEHERLALNSRVVAPALSSSSSGPLLDKAISTALMATISKIKLGDQNKKNQEVLSVPMHPIKHATPSPIKIIYIDPNLTDLSSMFTLSKNLCSVRPR